MTGIGYWSFPMSNQSNINLLLTLLSVICYCWAD